MPKFLLDFEDGYCKHENTKGGRVRHLEEERIALIQSYSKELSAKDATIAKMRKCLDEITEYPEERIAYDLAHQCLKEVTV